MSAFPFFKNEGKKDFLILLVIVVCYIILISYISYFRYVSFFSGNWDLGIMRQSLWTTTHGYLLYESGDFETFGVFSFLSQHSTYIAIPVAYLYAIYPHAILLFILQSIFLSMTAIPIYLISRKLGIERKYWPLLIVVFLLNFSVMSALFYDFHWESLIPFEFLMLFYFMESKKYPEAILAFIFGCMTLEIFPFILLGISLFLYIDNYLPESTERSEKQGMNLLTFIFFVIISIFSYAVLRILQFLVIPGLVGTTPSVTGLEGSFLNLISVNYSNIMSLYSLGYLAILIVSMAFLPVYRIRMLIVSLPWLFYIFILDPSIISSFGNQYALLTFPYIFLAFLYSFNALVNNKKKEFQAFIISVTFIILSISMLLIISGRSVSNWLLSNTFPETLFVLLGLIFSLSIAIFMSRSGRMKWTGLHKIPISRMFTLMLVAIVIFGLVLSPINPENIDATSMPGYNISFTENPEFPLAQVMAHYIPANASVVASNNLFSLVANDRNAYSLWWEPFNTEFLKYFPFNSTNVPTFIFIDSANDFLPSSLQNAILNGSVYGVKYYTSFNSFPNDIILYQKGYTGNPTYLGLTPLRSNLSFNYLNLFVGQDGRLIPDNSSPNGYAIESNYLSAQDKNIWYGPYILLPPGSYELTVSMELSGNNSSNYTGEAITLNGELNGCISFYSVNVSTSSLSFSHWQNISINFNMSQFSLNAEFRGYLDLPISISGSLHILMSSEKLTKLS